MKNIKNYIVPLVLLVFFGLASCNDTFEFHEKYTKDGEIIYATKVDTLKVLPGNGRVKIVGFLTKAFTVNEITVYWNKRENSQTFPYTKTANDSDTLSLVIPGLEEKSYEFDVYSKDAEGNQSIKETVFGTAYGETYRSNLEARSFNSFAYNNDKSVTIGLKPSSDLTRSTEIKYTNLSGEVVVVKVLSDESEAMLSQVDISKPITYRTFFVPTVARNGKETSIDQFDSDWLTYEFSNVLTTVLSSVTLEPNSGGVIAKWMNPESLSLKFDFKNLDKQGGEVLGTLSSTDAAGSYTFKGMKSEEQEIEITVSDIYGNSQTKSYTVTPLPAAGKGSWTIIDFSTEEDGGEGPVNGYATAAIDGDLSTFWHSNWSTGSSFPHHLTIDMGEEKKIAGFEIFRRNGNGGGATAHEFWVSSDNVTFTKVATLNAALNTNNGFKANATAVTNGRYVKYVATAGPNSYTFLSEINVFGLID